MERYFKRKSESTLPCEENAKLSKCKIEFNFADLLMDHGLRPPVKPSLFYFEVMFIIFNK